MKRLFTGIALLTLTLASGVALAQHQQNKPETLGRSLEGGYAGNGAGLSPDRLGNTAAKPANREAGNLIPTQSPRPTVNRNAGGKQVIPADRLGNTAAKPANRDAVQY
jgi:hypothetical protein